MSQNGAQKRLQDRYPVLDRLLGLLLVDFWSTFEPVWALFGPPILVRLCSTSLGPWGRPYGAYMGGLGPTPPPIWSLYGSYMGPIWPSYSCQTLQHEFGPLGPPIWEPLGPTPPTI